MQDVPRLRGRRRGLRTARQAFVSWNIRDVACGHTFSCVSAFAKETRKLRRRHEKRQVLVHELPTFGFGLFEDEPEEAACGSNTVPGAKHPGRTFSEDESNRFWRDEISLAAIIFGKLPTALG